MPRGYGTASRRGTAKRRYRYPRSKVFTVARTRAVPRLVVGRARCNCGTVLSWLVAGGVAPPSPWRGHMLIGTLVLFGGPVHTLPNTVPTQCGPCAGWLCHAKDNMLQCAVWRNPLRPGAPCASVCARHSA